MSAVSITQGSFKMGVDSPVRADSSTSVLVAVIILASAHITSPACTSMISPTTTVSDATTTFFPSRITVQWGDESFVNASQLEYHLTKRFLECMVTKKEDNKLLKILTPITNLSSNFIGIISPPKSYLSLFF